MGEPFLVIEAGFPPPRTQLRVCDGDGPTIAELDMGWEEARARRA